ncbi:unnamed protein product, partial [marine sediment metagenome]
WIATRKFVTVEPKFDSWDEEEEVGPPSEEEWEGAGTAIIIFSVPVFTGSLDAILIILGLVMIPASTLYLVKGGKDETSSLILFSNGCTRKEYSISFLANSWDLRTSCVSCIRSPSQHRFYL